MQSADSAARDTPAPRRGVADMRPCSRCGRTDPARMIALMALWFARFTDLPNHGGYFYLCPACYDQCIAPHFAPVVEHLVRQHQRDEYDDEFATDDGDTTNDPNPGTTDSPRSDTAHYST
jgi:hypothetical protein